MDLGTSIVGYKFIKTVGTKILKIRPENLPLLWRFEQRSFFTESTGMPHKDRFNMNSYVANFSSTCRDSQSSTIIVFII